MHRFKVVFLALVAAAGLVFASGCDQGVKEDSGDEEATAEAAKDEEKSEDPAEAGDEELPVEATGAVAVVDGTEITAERFNKAVKRQMGAMGNRPMPPRVAEMMKKRTIDRLIDEHLIDEQLEKSDVEVDSAEVDKEFAKFKERFPGEEQFAGFLEQNGVTEEEMKENLQKDLKLRKMLEKKYGIEVGEAEAKKYYDENPQRFEQKEQVRARHILIKLDKDADDKKVEEAKKRAEELAEKAKEEGTDFGALAKEKSEGPSAPRGGDLGFFTRKRMVPEFSEVAFKMQPGEISDPVKSQFGFHVIKVEEKKEAGKATFDEAKEEITTQLQRKQFRGAMQKFLGELKDGVEVERKEDNIKVNVEAPKGGQNPMMGGGLQGNPQLQKQIQEQLKKRAAEQQKSGNSDSKEPTKLKLKEPSLGK